MPSYQTTSKLIGSREALGNFQFVTINGKVEFEDKGKAVRVARAYSRVVRSAVKQLFEGRSVDELTKEFYRNWGLRGRKASPLPGRGDVSRPGFPKEKAKALRLSALSQALRFLSRIGVDYVVFEDLFLIMRRKFGNSKSGNRKISNFAKKQLLIHGVIKALRLGLNVILANPKGTTNSKEHDEVMKGKGFDRHTASAYLIALKDLEILNDFK